MTVTVVNVHERRWPVPAGRVGALIDTLASPADRLWPSAAWPRMTFDRPLSVGAVGGHGPIGYFIERYEPARSIVFRFTRPRGFDGTHRFDVRETGPASCVLCHTLEMVAHGPAVLTWPLFYRPLHDALIEDSFGTAERALGLPPVIRRWPARVRLLRRALAVGHAKRRRVP